MVGNVIYKEENFLSHHSASQKKVILSSLLVSKKPRRGAEDSRDRISGLPLSPPSATAPSGLPCLTSNSKPACGQRTSLDQTGPGLWSAPGCQAGAMLQAPGEPAPQGPASGVRE